MWNGGNRRPDRDEIDPVQSAIAAYTGRGGGYGHGPSYASAEAMRAQQYHHHYHDEEDPYHRRYHHQERPRAWSGDQGRMSSYHYPHQQRERGASDEYDYSDDPRGGHTTSWGSSAAASTRGSGMKERQHARKREDDGYDSSPQEETYNDDRKYAAEDEDNSSSREPSPVPKAAATSPPQPRGKPESLAAKFASAARAQEKLDELEAEREDVVAEALDESMDGMTPGAVASSAVIEDVTAEPATAEDLKPPAAPETPKSTTKKRKRKSPSTSSKKSKTSGTSASSSNAPSMDDPVPKISDAEYENLEALMVQFCRVPLLAEFSRPVSLLHPELMEVYSKIVDHPIDLGKVCRGIRRREYESLRAVRLDAWRIFANCVKYHSHPTNKDAVPSFVSIALHLRDYFNSLWQEHMLPSDPPRSASGKQQKTGPAAQLRAAFTKRAEERKKRSTVSGLTVMTPKCLERAAQALDEFLDEGGCVDKLDTVHLFGEKCKDEEEDVDIVVARLNKILSKLRQLAADEEEYSIEEFESDIRRSYTEDIFEFNPSIRARLGNRLDRLVGKIVVPVYEANCRGVTQSSIWGCMAAAVWARESSKKPFWPALVLGIMAPEDQREDWHSALTERNELRLPEKLRAQLLSGKRKAEVALKRQSLGQLEPQSYFLVEFLGTHEFIWVKESDMVENFDPNDDPNQHSGTPGSKKKRAGGRNSNVVGSKMYASGVEEGKWALEEFELQLQDTCGDPPDDEDDGEEMNYSYSLLCQSDDEADEEIQRKSVTGVLDVEECNELLATEGLMDFSVEGRKNAKKRAMALKKQKAEAEKKQKADKLKKQKAELVKKKKDAKSKERESKKEQRDLEKRRKKRIREREKAMKSSATKAKKSRKAASLTPTDLKKAPSGRRNLIACKRGRAQAIVDGYLSRVKGREDYKSLALGGVMTIPASLIDSSGLLGMTLAFRAAAGEIPMPEDSGTVQDTKQTPWDAIDVDGQSTSAAKVSCLEKQVELLEKEILRVKARAHRRKQLLSEALQAGQARDDKIAKEDSMARQNPFKKRRKVGATPEKKKSAKDRLTADEGNDDENEPKEQPDSSGDILAAESHDIESASHDADDDYDGGTTSIAGKDGAKVSGKGMINSEDHPAMEKSDSAETGAIGVDAEAGSVDECEVEEVAVEEADDAEGATGEDVAVVQVDSDMADVKEADVAKTEVGEKAS